MPEPMIFIGREDELEAIHWHISEREKAVICVKGRSKMGKTHLALKLLEELSEEPNVFCGFYRAEGAVEDPIYPFLEVLRQILQAYDKKESAEKVEQTIGRAFGSAVRERAGELFGAVVQDALGSLFKQLNKHLVTSSTTKAFSNIISDASKTWTTSAELSTMLAEHKPAVLTGFLHFCRNLAESASPEDRFVLFFDQVEHTSDVFWDFLLALARNLPERFYPLFTLNDEHDRGVEFWKKHGAELSSYGTQEMGLEGFSLDELRDLIDKHNKPPKDLGTLEAARKVTGGRPYFLVSWIRSEDYDKGVVPKDEKSFQQYHRQRLRACPEEPIKMAKALALLPDALPGGLEDYRTCFGKESLEEVEGLFDSLLQHGIFRRLPLKIWFIHEEMQEFIRDDMDPVVRKDRANDLIEGLQAVDPENLEPLSTYSLLAATVLTWTENHRKTYTLNSMWGRFFYSFSDYLAAWDHYQRALLAAEALDEKKKQSPRLSDLGLIARLWGRPQEALEYYNRALTIFNEVSDQKNAATMLNNIGRVYSYLGQKKKALDYCQRSLLIQSEEGDIIGEAASLNNIGGVYSALGQQDKALEYFEQALPKFREGNHKEGEAATLNNIGFIYSNLGQQEKALKYYEQALLIHREVGDRKGEATTLNNIGVVYDDLGKKDKALEYFEQALPISRDVGDRAGEATKLYNIANILAEERRLVEAISLLEQVVAIDKEIRSPKAGKYLAVLEMLHQQLREQQ